MESREKMPLKRIFALGKRIIALATVFTVTEQVRMRQSEQPKSAIGNDDTVG